MDFTIENDYHTCITLLFVKNCTNEPIMLYQNLYDVYIPDPSI